MRTIGIDLGTTNTVIAVDGQIVQQGRGGESSSVLPSVVAFPPSGATLVGVTAKSRRAIDPKNTIFSAKRLMGQGWHSYITAKFRRQYPFELVEKDGVPAFVTRAGSFTSGDVAAKVVVRALAELGPEQRRHAVVTVPVGFDQAARAATEAAVKEAGVEGVTVVSEPVAAAKAYLTTHGAGLRHVVVYDLGGGTFDLAVLDCAGGDVRVLAHAGDPYLGGDDIDNTIADWVADQVLKAHHWDLRSDAVVFDRLIVQCERAKLRLGFAGQARLELGQIDPASPFATHSIILDRDVLDRLASDLASRTFLLCDQALRAAALNARDIDAVFLSGGTTLLPTVRDGIARYFGKLPRCDYDPMEVVAIGASLMGP